MFRHSKKGVSFTPVPDGQLFPEKLTPSERYERVCRVACALGPVLREQAHVPTVILPRFMRADDTPHVGWPLDERWLSSPARQLENASTGRYHVVNYTEGEALYVPGAGEGLTLCRVMSDETQPHFLQTPLPDKLQTYEEPDFLHLHLWRHERRLPYSGEPVLGPMPDYTTESIAFLLKRFVHAYMIEDAVHAHIEEHRAETT
jgi:hypothetical protein